MISRFDINTFVNINDDGMDAGANEQSDSFIQQVVLSLVNAQMASNKYTNEFNKDYYASCLAARLFLHISNIDAFYFEGRMTFVL